LRTVAERRICFYPTVATANLNECGWFEWFDWFMRRFDCSLWVLTQLTTGKRIGSEFDGKTQARVHAKDFAFFLTL
jgi:hypothetical protein